MNDPDPTLTMHPPVSSAAANQPQETLIQRGAFDPPATPGTLGRLDRFEVLRLLGEGGMGQVYLAREPRTDTQVAIKILRPQAADDPQTVHRFLTEARHMYRLSHPRILRVLEVSDRPAGPYYVMPYIEGGSLLGQYKPGRPLPEERILSIARQIAEALAHAHSHGLIHRDLKPGNVLLDKEGNAYLTDFGLVRTVFNDSMVDASASHLEGTAPYMSPAVARGEAEDTRCDIYSFGALLYELLAGQPPYSARTPQFILDKILKGPPKPVREVNPKANPVLVRIAEGCMARELRDRYASMADVVVDLNRAAKGEAALGTHRRQRRSPLRFATALLGVLAVASLAGIALRHFTSTVQPRKTVESLQPPACSLQPATPSASQSAAHNLQSSSLQPTVSPPETSIHDFAFVAENGGVAIVKYTGKGGDVRIPAQVSGQPVIAVRDKAFEKCDGLAGVAIPASVKNIGAFAFSECRYLKSATLSDGLESIGSRAFFSCQSLADVTIPKTVKSIGTHAFSICEELTSVHIPASVTTIGHNPFGSTEKLAAFSVAPDSPAFSSGADGALFNKDKTVLVAVPGSRRGAYVVPEGVEAIQDGAFECCHHITVVTLPDGVRHIGRGAFRHCCNLRRVEVEEGIESIGEFAFMRCYSLEEITLPASLLDMGRGAFAEAARLQTVRFQGAAPSGRSLFTVFEGSPNATVYYRPGTKGWGETFGGRPTKMWESDNQRQTEPPSPVRSPSANIPTPTSPVPRSSSTAPAQSSATLTVGDAAPSLAQGKHLQCEPEAASGLGKVHVVEFPATWCSPCGMAIIPHITKRFGGDSKELGAADATANELECAPTPMKRVASAMLYWVAA